MALAAGFVACFLAPVSAWAQDGSPAPQEGVPPPAASESSLTPLSSSPSPTWGPTYHHKGQLGLSLLVGSGYRMVVPYEENIDCGDEENADKRVCTARSPTFVDLEASYGLSTRLDLVVATRLGIEKDFTSTRQFALMPGLRIWLDQDEALKFYTLVQGVYDSTDQRGTVSRTDVGARVGLGFMYDPIRNIGFFAQVGATFGFKRWFRIEADLGAGVQVRFP